MSKRGDNIHKRKDGRWEARYKSGTNKYGKTKYASVYGKTYTEVKQKLAEKLANPVQERKNKNNLLLKDILILWIKNNGLKHKPANEHKYLCLIETHIIPDLGDTKITDINSVMINNYLEKKMNNGNKVKRGGLSASYIKTMAFILKSSIHFAATEEYCTPLKSNIHIPNRTKKEFSVLSKDNQVLLETTLKSTFDTTHLGIFIALYTGLRIGEICALTWENFDFQKNILHVRHTISRIRCNDNSIPKTHLILDSPKTTSSIRDIPIPSILIPYLHEYYTGNADCFLLTGTNNFLSPRTFEYRYQRVLHRCGIPKQNFHSLRHTFATRCIESGVDIKSLSEILGHANVSITLDTYVHTSMETKRTQIEKFVVAQSSIMV